MRHGKRETFRSRKAVIVMTALVLILCCAAGGTLAWLAASTEAVTNTFTATQVECEVEDKYEDHEKTDIVVRVPDGAENLDAYVRVTLVPTWEDDNGNAVAKKVEGLTYPTALGTGWVKGSDGYYYYTKVVEESDGTPALFGEAIKIPTDPNGEYALNLQVLAEAIQADGVDSNGTPAVETVWPVTVGTDGTLSAK